MQSMAEVIGLLAVGEQNDVGSSDILSKEHVRIMECTRKVCCVMGGGLPSLVIFV